MVEFQKDCGLHLIKDLVSGDKNISRIYGFILYTDQNPYVVKVITRAENAVLPEYKQTVNVFRNVKTELESLNFKFKAIQRGKIAMRIAEFLSAFK